MIPDRSPDCILAPCRYPCPGCLRDVEATDHAEHIRGCVAVQARPLVEAAVRVAGSPSFHVDTFNDVIKEAFDLKRSKHQRWGRDVLSRLPYVTPFKHGLYRYDAEKSARA